jgi:excisionase family DNA binding protein
MEKTEKRGRPKKGAGRPRKQIPFADLPDKLIPEDICRFMNISKGTCYALLENRGNPNWRVGRLWIIPKYDFGVRFGFIGSSSESQHAV